MPSRINPDDTIADILATHREAAEVLLAYRMSCVGCAIAPFETLAEACGVYGVDVDRLIDDCERAAGRQEGDQ